MPAAIDDILDSVVLITGANSPKFGTGFAIRCEAGKTWILTCAHVVEDVGGAGNIYVDHQPAEVVVCGKRHEVDLAVLSVTGLGHPVKPLKLGFDGGIEIPCGIAGFAAFEGGQKKGEPLAGRLGNRVVLTASGERRTIAWKLLIAEESRLEDGYSGSPVICLRTRTVFAVATYSEYQGQRGYGISLDHLSEVWPAMPAELFPRQPLLGRWPTGAQREYLENLFLNLPVSTEELRALCRRIMSADAPWEIPADASALDLLEWLVERGQLASGQAPLVSVLQQLLPLIDASARERLRQCTVEVAAHFGIKDPQAMPAPRPVAAEAAPALMLELWPMASRGHRCSVQGWLFYSAGRIFSVAVREQDNALNLDDPQDLMDFVTCLRAILDRRGVAIEQVMIEFVLPRDLLSCPMDQWMNDAEEPLGACSPVVVRPKERVLAAQDSMAPRQLWWYEKDLWRHVRGKLKEGVCAVLGFVPDLLSHPRQHDAPYLLSVGASFALWPRQPEGLADLRPQLEGFLADQPLPDLPAIVRDLRYQLWEGEKEHSPCYHLTLLWDDPARPLPRPKTDDEFYQAPV